MKLNFIADPNSINYIDCWAEISKVNRRFMRQGYNLAIANVKVVQLPATVVATGSSGYVNSLCHNWPTANAWVKAYHAWKNQQDAAIDEMGAQSAVARFRDFKVSMEEHAGGAVQLSPISIGPGRLAGPYSTGIIYGTQVAAAEEGIIRKL